MKASFFERLGAYFLDSIIVGLIFSLICLGVSSNQSITEKQMEALDNQLLAGEITNAAYLEEYNDLLYKHQKENVLELSISAALTIAYYVVFQYMYKGQTLGKKVLGIKVVDNATENEVPIIKGLLRSLLIHNILSSVLNIILLFILNNNMYFTGYGIIVGIEVIFILITVMFVLYKKDGRGLHDIITNTKVIKESR